MRSDQFGNGRASTALLALPSCNRKSLDGVAPGEMPLNPRLGATLGFVDWYLDIFQTPQPTLWGNMKRNGSENDLLVSKLFRKVVLLLPNCGLVANISIMGGQSFTKVVQMSKLGLVN